MSTIEIIRLNSNYVRMLKDFFQEINSPEYTDFFSPHPFNEEYAERICHHRGRDLYYAILKNGADIVGYGMLRGWDEGYEIPSIGLCISRRYQRSGLGKMLLEFLEAVVKFMGGVQVMLKVKKNNAVALRLYKQAKYTFKEHDEDSWVGFKNLRPKS